MLVKGIERLDKGIKRTSSLLTIMSYRFPECIAKGSCFKWVSGGWTLFAARSRERSRTYSRRGRGSSGSDRNFIEFDAT